MKNKKKDIYGRTYTTFGYCLHLFLTAVGAISFLCILGYTGSCETDMMTFEECVVRTVICFAVFGASVFLHKKIFD